MNAAAAVVWALYALGASTLGHAHQWLHRSGETRLGTWSHYQWLEDKVARWVLEERGWVIQQIRPSTRRYWSPGHVVGTGHFAAGAADPEPPQPRFGAMPAGPAAGAAGAFGFGQADPSGACGAAAGRPAASQPPPPPPPGHPRIDAKGPPPAPPLRPPAPPVPVFSGPAPKPPATQPPDAPAPPAWPPQGTQAWLQTAAGEANTAAQAAAAPEAPPVPRRWGKGPAIQSAQEVDTQDDRAAGAAPSASVVPSEDEAARAASSLRLDPYTAWMKRQAAKDANKVQRPSGWDNWQDAAQDSPFPAAGPAKDVCSCCPVCHSFAFRAEKREGMEVV